MATFRFGRDVNMKWNGNEIVGPAGTIFRIEDAYYDEFDSQVGNAEPTLEWIETNEFQALQASVSVTTLEAVAPIVVTPTSSGRSISLNANYQTAGTYVTSVAGTAPISATGTTAITVSVDQSTLTASAATFAETVRAYVKNTTGSTIPKGSAVYVSGATGDNALISLATASTEAGSSKTLGLTESSIPTDGFGYVIESGLISGVNTSAATAGQAVWLGNTPGSFVFGSPPSEPSHSVYLGVVIRVQSNNGEILVKVQNGYELDELHDVSASSPSDGDIIQYKTSSSLWTKESIAGAGISPSTHTHAYQPAGTYVTAVSGTAPISASTNTAGAVTVSLSASYASSTHTHATSDVTSGNFVATLAAGTGVTVTGADGNASTKTVAIGQEVATSSSPTFASATITGNVDAGTYDKVTITTPATSATLTIANTKTFTASNTLTLTGTDASSVDLGNGGSLAPAGVVQAYLGAFNNIPTGWLLCAGAAVSRTTYATLFGVIGTTFGAGDGSTTFTLPSLAGHMIVGFQTGTPGTAQQTGTGDSYTNATWDHSHSHNHVTNPAATASGVPSSSGAGQSGSGVTVPSSNHTHSTDIAATTSDTDSTAMSTSPTQKRTRVNYIIKW